MLVAFIVVIALGLVAVVSLLVSSGDDNSLVEEEVMVFMELVMEKVVFEVGFGVAAAT